MLSSGMKIMFEITQFSKKLFNGIKSNLSWRDLIGFFSLSLYLLASAFAISLDEASKYPLSLQK